MDGWNQEVAEERGQCCEEGSKHGCGEWAGEVREEGVEEGRVERRKGCAEVMCEFLEEVKKTRKCFGICKIKSGLPVLHDVSPVMEEQGHGSGERLCLVGKLDKRGGQIELSPLLEGIVKVGFVVGYVMIEFASELKCRGKVDVF